MSVNYSFVYIPLSTLYRAVTHTRLAAYRYGWFKTSKLPAPVISVGNLTVGGTGKTPLVEWVCRAIASTFESEPKRTCVLTRGYGRENPDTQVLVSNGLEIFANEREAGDEAFLLANNLRGIAAVICNPDRTAAGEWAIKNLNSEVFVLDDGFQHLRLARDLDIVAIDATDPWGGGELLPTGRLREAAAGVARANCVVLTRVDQGRDQGSLSEEVQKLAGGVPIFTSMVAVKNVTTLDGKTADSSAFRSKPIAAFCAVGNPESFFKLLVREGYQLAMTKSFRDHYRYTQADIGALVSQAKAHGAESLITTAKDATKLTPFRFDLPCHVLEIEILVDNDTRLREMIRNIILNSRQGS